MNKRKKVETNKASRQNYKQTHFDEQTYKRKKVETNEALKQT